MLARNDWDPVAFVRPGAYFLSAEQGDPARYAHLAAERITLYGYDGQFGYYLAVEGLQAAARMDQPAYRAQHLLLPLLARLLSAGSVDALPWALLAVNLAAVGAGVEALVRLLGRAGQPMAAALAYALWPGIVFGVRLDLHEPLAFGLVALALLARSAGRWLAASSLLALSALAREATLLFAVAAVAAEWSAGRARRALLTLLVVGAPVLVQQALLLLAFGSPSWGDPYRRPALPFSAYLWARDAPNLWLELAFVAAPAAAALAYATVRLLRGARDLPTLACLLYAGLLVLLPEYTGQDFWTATRAGTGLLVAGLALGAGPAPAALRVVVLVPLCWPALGIATLAGSDLLGIG